jgi:class 3 adenylate cyclase
VTSVQTVTVLITDLVGSTGLESRVGPAAADEIRSEHFGLIRRAVDAAGGQEVKNTGDGLMVVFDSAAAAAICAADVQQRFEFRNREASEQLLVKVGLSAGDASVEDGDYFGMPMIEAARLCDRCSPGQILAKALVAHLTAGRGPKFKSLGPLELKGLPEPLETVEVVWERRPDEHWTASLPPRVQEAPPTGLVGRVDESERLSALFDEAAAGERRLALLSGEPGIGKTRLATHTALTARGQSGAGVLYGRCDEELAIPYGPWVEALSHYVDHGPERVLRAHVERHGGELSRMLPGLDHRLAEVPPASTTDPDTERYLLWGAIVGLLREATAHEPLVLILDDLHWADKPSVLLLKHLLTEGRGVRMLIIGTYRDSDLQRGHPLSEVLAALHGVDGVERLALGGLAQPEIVEMMERAAGHELDQAGLSLSREVLRETDGNPFYTGELLRHLRESGVIYQQENGRFTVRGKMSELGLPQSVREVLGRRVERLGEDTHRVLSVAAVIGREFDLELLVAVTERDEDEVLELLEKAVGASVLIESAGAPGRFYFAHGLINHTLYQDLGNTRRARLHRRIGERMEEQLGDDPGARVGELAHHWAEATTAVDADKALSYAKLAGERALNELAPDEALRWFTHALELLGERADVAQRCEVLIGLGEAQRLTGDAGYRETLLEASRIASVLADAGLAATAALRNSRGFSSVIGEVDGERLAAIDRALELDDGSNPGRRGRLLALQASELAFDAAEVRRRRELVAEAISLGQQANDPRTLGAVLRDSFQALWSADTVPWRVELTRELSRCAAEAQDPALRWWGYHSECVVCTEQGRLAEAQEAMARMLQLAEEVAQPTLSWISHEHAAALELLRGNLAAAERLATAAFQIGQAAGEDDAVLYYGAQISVIRTYAGHAADMVDMVEQSVAAYPRIPAWRAGLASLYCWVDRLDDAAAILRDAARDRFDHIPWDPTHTCTLALYADAASQTGLRETAALLHELFQPWADQVACTDANGYGHVKLWMGLLSAAVGRHDQADEELEFACRFHEANGVPLWGARGHLGWAESLAGRGDTPLAREHAAKALQIATEQGYGAIAARAEAIAGASSAIEA